MNEAMIGWIRKSYVCVFMYVFSNVDTAEMLYQIQSIKYLYWEFMFVAGVNFGIYPLYSSGGLKGVAVIGSRIWVPIIGSEHYVVVVLVYCLRRVYARIHVGSVCPFNPSPSPPFGVSEGQDIAATLLKWSTYLSMSDRKKNSVLLSSLSIFYCPGMTTTVHRRPRNRGILLRAWELLVLFNPYFCYKIGNSIRLK